MTPRATPGDPRYRTIDEARTLQVLVAQGWPLEARAGEARSAEREAKAALDAAVAMGLPHGVADTGARLFDPDEAVNFLDEAARRQGGLAWDRRVVSGRRLVWQAHGHRPDQDDATVPPPPSTLVDRRFAVTLLRTFNLQAYRPGEEVRLRLPLPIEDHTLSDVGITFLPPTGTRARLRRGPARLDAVVEVPQSREAAIGVKIALTSRPWRAEPQIVPLEPGETELYTRQSEGLIRTSGRVRALADDLAQGQTDALSVVRRFWSFIHESLVFGVVHYDQFAGDEPLDWVLQAGWCDCNLGSALFAALCRTQGIPARLATGYLLHPQWPAFHSWTEVWTPAAGWTPFDFGAASLGSAAAPAPWRDHYFAALDYRMTVQRLPRLFNGTGAVRLPSAWRMLHCLDGAGMSVSFLSVDTGALVYREYAEVEQLR